MTAAVCIISRAPLNRSNLAFKEAASVSGTSVSLNVLPPRT